MQPLKFRNGINNFILHGYGACDYLSMLGLKSRSKLKGVPSGEVGGGPGRGRGYGGMGTGLVQEGGDYSTVMRFILFFLHVDTCATPEKVVICKCAF